MGEAVQAAEKAVTLGDQYLINRTLGDHAAFVQERDFRTNGEGVRGFVRDHDDLRVMLAEPELQTGEEGVAGGAVEGREGFVEEQKARTRGQGASEGNALRLTAGEILRAAIGKLCRANEFEHLINASGAIAAVYLCQAVGHIGCDAQMREERGLLRDKRSLAASRSGPGTAGCVRKDAAVECDAGDFASTVACPVEAGEKANDGAFAGAGGAEDDGPGGGEAALDLKVEAAAAGFERKFKHQCLRGWFDAPGRWCRWQRVRLR